mmetsp:Transcript_38364/g.86285  ORF Transcript_38364/g.86285 Transcript_38364/m.86285 type:complete len:200 (-) Transcript_38364:307-906(-)
MPRYLPVGAPSIVPRAAHAQNSGRQLLSESTPRVVQLTSIAKAEFWAKQLLSSFRSTSVVVFHCDRLAAATAVWPPMVSAIAPRSSPKCHGGLYVQPSVAVLPRSFLWPPGTCSPRPSRHQSHDESGQKRHCRQQQSLQGSSPIAAFLDSLAQTVALPTSGLSTSHRLRTAPPRRDPLFGSALPRPPNAKCHKASRAAA